LEVFVPLVYKPGDVGEVDFFEVLVDICGARSKAHMFVLRLMHSGRDFAWFYPRQDQTCFLDGHVRAFAHLGAVPHRLIYDNLKAAGYFSRMAIASRAWIRAGTAHARCGRGTTDNRRPGERTGRVGACGRRAVVVCVLIEDARVISGGLKP
jgi:transposase